LLIRLGRRRQVRRAGRGRRQARRERRRRGRDRRPRLSRDWLSLTVRRPILTVPVTLCVRVAGVVVPARLVGVVMGKSSRSPALNLSKGDRYLCQGATSVKRARDYCLGASSPQGIAQSGNGSRGWSLDPAGSDRAWHELLRWHDHAAPAECRPAWPACHLRKVFDG
jgi:hypothetical protein